jgi:hypothetical protein
MLWMLYLITALANDSAPATPHYLFAHAIETNDESNTERKHSSK